MKIIHLYSKINETFLIMIKIMNLYVVVILKKYRIEFQFVNLKFNLLNKICLVLRIKVKSYAN